MAAEKEIDAIIMVTASRWDQDISSASISLAQELSKKKKLFFMDHPFTWKDVLFGLKNPMIRKRLSALLFGKNIYKQIEAGNDNWIAVTPFAIIPINWLPAGRLYNLLSDFNNWLFMRAVKRVIKENNLKRYLWINSYNPFFGYALPSDVKPVLNIYQSRDNIRESEYVYKHGPQLEQKAAKIADLRLATSSDLVDILSTDALPFKLFPNAANTDLFNKTDEYIRNNDRPTEMRDIQTKVIGYIGNICHRVDYDLVVKLAREFSDCTLVLVGPRNDAKHHNYNLEALKNVVFTGPKNIKQLPHYLAFMDVAILPFKVNALTRSIYPLKINEYLAGGKPVVSTAFSPDIQAFGDVISVANDHDAFIAAVRTALSANDGSLIQVRRDKASQNSWVARGGQFWEVVENHN